MQGFWGQKEQMWLFAATQYFVANVVKTAQRCLHRWTFEASGEPGDWYNWNNIETL